MIAPRSSPVERVRRLCAVALDHLRACRDEQLFNRGPLNRSRHGIGEDRGKGFAVFMVHRGI